MLRFPKAFGHGSGGKKAVRGYPEIPSLDAIHGPSIGGHVISLRVSATALSLAVASIATGLAASQPGSAAAGAPATIVRVMTFAETGGAATNPYGGPRRITLAQGTYTWSEDITTEAYDPDPRTLVLAAGDYDWECFVTGTTRASIYTTYCLLENVSTKTEATLPYGGVYEIGIPAGTHTWTSTLTRVG